MLITTKNFKFYTHKHRPPKDSEKLEDYQRVKTWKSDLHSDVSHLFFSCAVWPTPRVDPNCKALSNDSFTSRQTLFFWLGESEIWTPSGQFGENLRDEKVKKRDPLILLINKYHRNSWAKHAWKSQMRIQKALVAEQRFEPSVQVSF